MVAPGCILSSSADSISRAPNERLSQRPLRDIPRLLVVYKDFLKRCFYHLEKFDLFGYLS